MTSGGYTREEAASFQTFIGWRAWMTRGRRSMLELAVRSPTGNPWPLLSMSQRSGGAKSRMFEEMKLIGLFDDRNCITDLGREALAAAGDRS